jgi:hypothetical protein
LENILKPAIMICFKILFWHISGETEESHEIALSWWPVFGPRFGPGISRIERKSANHLTSTFSKTWYWRLLHCEFYSSSYQYNVNPVQLNWNWNLLMFSQTNYRTINWHRTISRPLLSYFLNIQCNLDNPNQLSTGVFGLSNCSNYRISNIIEFCSKIFIQKIERYILYINNQQFLRNPLTFNYTPDSGNAVTGLHLSPPREAGPLTHNVMFHKNSFLVQGSKIIRFCL